MLGTINPEILFLQEEDEVKAGLLDMKQILEITEKTYALLGKGEIQNPPKTHLGIPEGSGENFDSFFNTMPCHIAGDMNIAGVKWAAESNANATTPGIPYGIDITILSDPATVLPFCILDGTVITAMRTSAVAGFQAKHCAPSDTKTVTMIGAGVIGRTMIMAICEAIPTVETIYLCDLDVAKAEALAAEYKDQYNVEIIASADSKACADKSELIIGETTARKPFIDASWVKPHSAIVCVSNEANEEVVKAADVNVVDYWKQMKTFENKAIVKMVEAGELAEEDIVETSELALGKQVRTSDDQFIYACSLGLGALDITVGYQIYKNAMDMGLGTTVKMWDKPLWE
jgi:ornithine cyclodeaminase